MSTLQSRIQAALFGLALVIAGTPANAEGQCVEHYYSCPNNGNMCFLMSCIDGEPGWEVYYQEKTCDGWVQTIIYGQGYLWQETPCADGGPESTEYSQSSRRIPIIRNHVPVPKGMD